MVGLLPLFGQSINSEFDVDRYDTTAPNDVTGAEIPYTVSIPTRNGIAVDKVKAILIAAPGISSTFPHVSYTADSRWHKWLHANELAYLDIGDEYEHSDSIIQALDQIAASSGYPELEHAPIMIFGESAGGSTAFYFARDVPARVIAFATEHTRYWDDHIPAETYQVPAYFRWGEFDDMRWSDGYWDIDGDNIKDKLNRGALWMTAGEDRQQHATKRYALEEAIGYFSLILPLRYTYEEGVMGKDAKLGPVTLNTLVREDGYLGEINMGAVQTPRYDMNSNLLKDWESTDPYYAPYATAERSDKLEHNWMPNSKIAAFWATKITNGEHDLDVRYLDTLEDDYGLDTQVNRGSYFPNTFTTDQQVRIEVIASDFPNISEMQFWRNDQLVATDATPPYTHAYTFTEWETGVHFIYPVAIDENGQRCVGRRRVIQVYSNTYASNTSPTVSDIDPLLGEPGTTLEIPFTIGDAETSADSLSLSWVKINNTDDFSSSDYTASFSGSGANRVLNLTLPNANGILWGMVQVSDGDMSVNEYVQVQMGANDGYAPPFFVEGEKLIYTGPVFMGGSWSKRISLHVFDYDTPVEDLTIIATSSNQGVLPDENIIVGGVGRFRYIQVKPLSGGYCAVTVEVSDGHTSTTTTFGVPSKTLINYPPVISDIPDQTVSAGRSSDPIEVRAYDLQTPGEALIGGETTLSLTVTSDDQSLVADGDISVVSVGERRRIKFQPSSSNTGTATLTATISDEGGLTATDTFTVTVNAAAPLSVAGGNLGPAFLGQDVAEILTATGGIGPLSWSLAGGSLPTGLTLNADGSFSGTPQQTGDFTFTASVSDANSDTDSAPFTLHVDAWLPLPGNITLTAENDSTVTMSWSDDATGETGYEIQRSPRNQVAWSTVTTTGADATSYNDASVTAGEQYNYRIRTLGDGPSPYSEVFFVEVQSAPSIITQPQSTVAVYLTTPSIEVTALGGALTFQWYEGLSGDTSTPLSGETTKRLTIDNIENTRHFWVRVSNGVGSIDSGTATLTVNKTTWPIYLDFGSVVTPSPDGEGRHWNTMDSPNGTRDGLIDSAGDSTLISFSSSGFFKVSTYSENPVSPLYPDSAVDDVLWAHNSNENSSTNPLAAITISGLEAGEDYDLKIFATADNDNGYYTTTYIIDGESQTFDPGGNTSTFVEFTKLIADASGEIRMEVVTGEYSPGFINVMEIHKSLALELSETDVSVPEGSTSTFDLRLNRAPDTDQTVNIARASGDADISLGSSASLTFSPANWDQWQTVTLQAAEDADTDDGTAIFECAGTGVDTVTVNATEADNDLAIEVDQTSLTVGEGGSANIQIRLNSAPLTTSTVNVSRLSGDADISVGIESELIFTPENYYSWQTVFLHAAQDVDNENGSATIRLSATDAADVDVVVTEVDDDYAVVAEGLLASWELDAITNSPLVTEVNAGFLADGLSAGLLTHSDPAEMRGVNDALRAIDNNEPNLAASITAGNYFKWTLQVDADHVVQISDVVLRSKIDGSTMSLALLCDAIGLTAGDALETIPPGLQMSDISMTMDPVSGSVEFRVYGYGTSSAYDGMLIGHSYKTDGLNDIEIYGQVVYSSPPPTTFAGWAARYSLAADSTLDSDTDGVVNLMEYALRLNPNLNQGIGMPTGGVVEEGGQLYQTFRFRRNLEATDLTYVLEGADVLGDPSAWEPLTIAPADETVVDPDVDGDGKVELIELKVNINDKTRHFLRLEAVR